jgi:hypothetical protein
MLVSVCELELKGDVELETALLALVYSASAALDSANLSAAFLPP